MSMLDLLGLNRIFKGGTEVKPTRKILNFIGDGITITDNPTLKRTDITVVSSAAEGTVTGPEESTPGQLAVWNNSDGTELAAGPAVDTLATEAYVDDAIAAIPPPTGTGDTFSGAVSADNEIARYDGTNNKTIQRSTPKIADDGRITTVTDPTGAQDADTKAARDVAISAAASSWSTAVFRGYAGHASSSVGVPPTTWSDVVSGLALTWVDDIQSGVTRSGSSFTFTAPGYYRLSAFINLGGINCFLAMRWRRGSTTVASRNVYNTVDPDYYHQAPTWFDHIVYVAAGDVLTLQVARSGGGAGAGWAGSAIDGETAWTAQVNIARVGPGVGDPGVGLSPSTNWRTYCDFNFTQMATQAIVQGVNTIGGIPMRADNVANATTFSIINGTGLYVKNTTTSSSFYYSLRNAPMLYVDLPVDIPGWILDISEVRISAEWTTTVATANYSASGFGLAKQPWVNNADLSVHFWHQYTGGLRRAIARLANATEQSPAISSTYNTGLIHFKNQHMHTWYAKQNLAADTVANSLVLDPATMTRVGSIYEVGGTGNVINAATQYITNMDRFIAFWSGHSDNALGNAEHVCKRLRIEYKL